MKSQLEWALEHAKAGWHVFPLVDNGKEPRPEMTRWQYQATTDPTRITHWFTRWPRANIAGITAGRVVVDVDIKKNGHETLMMLDTIHGITQTRTARTASGGHHLIYDAPVVLRNGTNVWAGIDVRATGGYIALPGSKIDGKRYAWYNDLPVAVAPQWVVDECKKGRQKDKNAGDRLIEADDVAESLAQAWLRDHTQDVIEGGRDSKGFEVACKLYDFGVDDATALALLADWNEVRCHPPLEEPDIARLARSGRENRQTPIGILHPKANAFDAVDGIEDRLAAPAPVDAVVDHPKEYALDTFDSATAKALDNANDPLIEGLIERGTFIVTFGESGGGKSFLKLDKYYNVAAGHLWQGRKTRRGAVVYVALEGGRGIYKRAMALKLKHPEDKDVPLFIIQANLDLLRNAKDVDLLCQWAAEAEKRSGLKVEAIVIDTLSRLLAGGDENSPTDLGIVVRRLDLVRARTGAAIDVVHHTGKDKTKGARGHSLLRAAADTELEVNGHQMRVTKQRDLDTDVVVDFELKRVRVGFDSEGREVTSCTFEKASAVAKFPGEEKEPGKAARQVLELIDNELRRLKDLGTPRLKPFGWQFVQNVRSDISNVRSDRTRITGHLSELENLTFLKKVKPNQYVRNVRKMSENVRS